MPDLTRVLEAVVRGGHLTRRAAGAEYPAPADRQAERLLEPRAAEVVKLRYFRGLTREKFAVALRD